jgi:hypothetical protein
MAMHKSVSSGLGASLAVGLSVSSAAAILHGKITEVMPPLSAGGAIFSESQGAERSSGIDDSRNGDAVLSPLQRPYELGFFGELAEGDVDGGLTDAH